MATQVPVMAVRVVDSLNRVIEAGGAAGSTSAVPSLVLRAVSSAGKIIESTGAAGSVDGLSPAMAVRIVDSTNHIIKSDGTASSATAQPAAVVRFVGSNQTIYPGTGTASPMMDVRVVDENAVILDVLFGGGGIQVDNLSIAQGAANNDDVGTATVGGSHTGTASWSISSQTPAGVFKINSSTGLIEVLSNTALATNASIAITISVSGLTPSVSDLSTTIYVVPSALVIDMIAASDTGSSSTDNITTVNQPTFAVSGGTIYAGDTIRFYDNGVVRIGQTVTSGQVSSGQIQIGTTLSEGTHPITATIVRGTYENTASNSISVVVDRTAPTISTSATATVAENATLSISLVADETVTWAITGGADSAQFEISSTTLRWASDGTQNYEAPADANADNAYVVQVTATDVAGNTTNKTITVSVTDVAEGGGTSGEAIGLLLALTKAA